MKKLLQITFILVAVSLSAQADIKTMVGFKGGLSFNAIRFSSTAASRTSTGFHLGGFADFQFQPYVGMQIEANYWNLGRILGASVNTFSTISIPVMYKLKFDTNSGFRPYLLAGPEIDLKVSGPSSGVKSLSFGIVSGGGCEYWFSPTMAVLLDARYLFGLTDLNDPSGTVTAKLGAIHVATGMSFAL